jgi:Fe-S cluster biogenesis protein NfuA
VLPAPIFARWKLASRNESYGPQDEGPLPVFLESWAILKENLMREKVEKVIEEIRPFLQADGGNIELIDVQEGVVKVKLVGACGSCPMSQLTLKRGVEARLKAQIPEVKEVVAI